MLCQGPYYGARPFSPTSPEAVQPMRRPALLPRLFLALGPRLLHLPTVPSLFELEGFPVAAFMTIRHQSTALGMVRTNELLVSFGLQRDAATESFKAAESGILL